MFYNANWNESWTSITWRERCQWHRLALKELFRSLFCPPPEKKEFYPTNFIYKSLRQRCIMCISNLSQLSSREIWISNSEAKLRSFLMYVLEIFIFHRVLSLHIDNTTSLNSLFFLSEPPYLCQVLNFQVVTIRKLGESERLSDVTPFPS